MTQQTDLDLARDLAENNELDKSYVIADRYLKECPDDPMWLTLMTYIMLGSEKTTLAYSLAKRCTQLIPKDPGSWMNLGMAAGDLKLFDKAERAYRKGLKCKDQRLHELLNVNLSAVMIDSGRFVEAEPFCREAIKFNPESKKGHANLSFCQLAQRKWQEGWKNYHYTLGESWRPRPQYNNEPEWDGKGKGTIVASADQGMGDVISFASMVPDIKQWCDENDSRLILDVNKRLANLFKRTFPDVTVYGTRREKSLNWALCDREIDYSLALGQFGEHFRNSDEDFPGTPYLIPDPDREIQWKALFESKQKPCIGIAWRGGIPKTGSKFRQLDLEQLLPLFESVDAHWVSLQYKPAQKEIDAFREKHPDVDICEYPRATLTNDYDDTVGMVAALDMCITMHTTVNHAAGGLGVPCWVFVPKTSQWRYGYEGEDFVWAKSLRLIRQNERGRWDDVIEQTGKDLNARFSGVHKAAGKATRDGKVRRDGSQVRNNGKRYHRQAGDRPSA